MEMQRENVFFQLILTYPWRELSVVLFGNENE
jgi:hypothetical protein